MQCSEMGCKIWDKFCISEEENFFETNPQLSLTLIFIFYRRSHLTYMFLLGILTKIVIVFAAGFVDLSGFNLSLASCVLSTSFSFLGLKYHMFRKQSSNQRGYFGAKLSCISDYKLTWSRVCLKSFRETTCIAMQLNCPIIAWNYCHSRHYQ